MTLAKAFVSGVVVKAPEKRFTQNDMAIASFTLNIDNANYSFMFSKSKKSTDPTGFDLLALACGLPVNRADILYKPEYLGKSTGTFLINLKDAFDVKDLNIIKDKNILLIDDIIDNGATIKNIAKYLLQNGAKKVDALVIAKTLIGYE